MKRELKALTRQQRIRGTIGLTLILAVAGTGGCGKKKDSASTPPPQTASAIDTNGQTAPPAPPPAQAGAAPAVQANGQPDLAEINRAMIRWIVGHRRAPNNFQEFAATAGVTIPPPPPGKKYVIAPSRQVQLVDQ